MPMAVWVCCLLFCFPHFLWVLSLPSLPHPQPPTPYTHTDLLLTNAMCPGLLLPQGPSFPNIETCLVSTISALAPAMPRHCQARLLPTFVCMFVHTRAHELCVFCVMCKLPSNSNKLWVIFSSTQWFQRRKTLST